MKNNDKHNSDIYKAFNSVVSPDNTVKQRIFNNVMNNEKKGNFRLRNTLIPAAAFSILMINAGMIYTSVNSGSEVKNNENPETEKAVLYTADVLKNKTSEKICADTTPPYEKNIISEITTTVPVSITSPVYSSCSSFITSELPCIPSETHITSEIISEMSIQTIQTTIPSEETLTETSTTNTVITENEKISGELLPPVSNELQQLYNNAYEIYKELTLGMNRFTDYDENGNYSCEEKDIIIDGKVYTKASSDYFKTLEDVSVYFHQYFTDRFIQELNILSGFTEYEGNIYFESHAKDGYIGYAGHTYEITAQTDDEINIKVICYIYENTEEFTGEYFFETPEDLTQFDIVERKIRFNKENNEWRIDHTELMW